MVNTYSISVCLVTALALNTVTTARYIQLQGTDERLAKRTMSDQRLAELQALIALSKGQGIPIGHGQIDPWVIGKRRKRSIGSIFGTLNTDQKMRVLNRLLTRGDDSGDANSL